ncbi:MAG: glutathione peroxidase [Xanthomonadales bacterium]|jgi:glutathione peroxidase|nr:glutathione peroxidase [Xanthomonadales bacterium]MCX7052418.1 glutathione peroxidase [Pseudomonadota bacterium]
MTTVHDFTVRTIEGAEQSLGEHRGKVLLIVNVASRCGLTPQYTALEALQRKHAARGFSVLGFPCNQFGGQEPGTEAQILEFCTLNYEVSFPMYGKVEVNGEGTHPLYAHLKSEAPGLLGSESLKWNFTKFLVDREGRVVRRYAPTDSPESIEKDIEVLL